MLLGSCGRSILYGHGPMPRIGGELSESRLLVFGDIHGSIGAVQRVLARVEPRRDDTLLFLGDYIDRGEDSRAVLDLMMDLDRKHRCIFLKGNHEDMFLRACEG